MKAICRVEEVSEDEPLRVELPDGHVLAVYQWQGEYYCTDDLCSHGEASLAEGYVENGEIFCPYHMGSFCIKTGAPRAAPCSVPVAAYAVTVVDGEICIGERVGDDQEK